MPDPFDSPMSFPTYRPKGEVHLDHYGRYLLPDPETGKERSWTRATTFAKSISDTYTLSKWGERMAIKGLTMRPDLFALAAATPLSDRIELNRVAESAKETAGAKTAAHLGTALHSFTEAVDRGEEPNVPAPWDADVAAYRAAMKTYQVKVLPGMVERIVIVPDFGVAGTFDRIGTSPFSDQPMVMDLKTGRDLEYGWNEIAIQLALYAHADAIWDPKAGVYESFPEVDWTFALVFHLPVGQATCTVYEVDISVGWEAAELCAKVRSWRKQREIASPLGTVTAEALPSAPSWPDKITSASSLGELSAIYREAVAQGQWTGYLRKLGLRRKADLDTA